MLMDSHGTSLVMFRNTRQGVKGFPARRMNERVIGCTRNTSFSSLRGKTPPSGTSTRAQWLVDFLLEQRQEKVLVIFAHTGAAAGAGVVRTGRHLCAAAYFASEKDGAQVLLCSEIGYEGLNFQFASQMVMFDLPFNPDLLEQRISRLDRIGQSREIQIYIPYSYMEQSTQAVLLRWYHEGLDAFEHTCPTDRALYDEAYQTLLGYLAEPGATAFLHDCGARHDALKAQNGAGPRPPA